MSHHTAGGFRNTDESASPSFRDVLRWQFSKRDPVPGHRSYHFPLAHNDPGFLQQNRDQTTLTWIGHATVLLQTGGVNILTDPQFSERASPVPWLGPKRIVPPGLTLDQLPLIDVVIISHDHYDSLDKPSIHRLHRRPGGKETLFAAPLGIGRWLRRRGIRNVVELDWWQDEFYRDVQLTAVPVRHWSKRGLLSHNRTLWAGWAVRGRDFSFLFLGDSGYTRHFMEIGERLGPFDLAAIPIGAYEPRWLMRYYHINPEEAVKAHQDLRARQSVAIHWGTFILTDEPLDEPPRLLARARKRAGLADDAFLVLQHGQTIFPHKRDPSVETQDARLATR